MVNVFRITRIMVLAFVFRDNVQMFAHVIKKQKLLKQTAKRFCRICNGVIHPIKIHVCYIQKPAKQKFPKFFIASTISKQRRILQIMNLFPRFAVRLSIAISVGLLVSWQDISSTLKHQVTLPENECDCLPVLGFRKVC